MKRKSTIVLSGMMGTGKSSVGEVLAKRLGVPFVDTDRAIEARTNMSVRDLFTTQGETAFRLLEHEIVKQALLQPEAKVVAFGGGVVTQNDLRRLAVDHAFVVTLDAEPATLLRRIGDPTSRPKIDKEQPLETLITLREARADAYAEAHACFLTDDLSVDEVCDRILSAWEDSPAIVPMGRSTYLVEHATAKPDVLIDRIAALAPSSLVLVTDSHVERHHGKAIRKTLSALAIPLNQVTLPAGEIHKNLSSVQLLWDACLGQGIDRDTLLLAFGGGTVGDLTGFAASTLLRGIRCLQIPTTLLSMVDSSVGGKTAFDHANGKNLIGTFFNPVGVVLDFGTLGSLPDREYRSGFAEIIKIATLTSKALFEQLEREADRLLARDPVALEAVVFESIQQKARIVRNDPHDLGDRLLLNFGHTLGHALESASGYSKLLHGEAVSLGMVGELSFLKDEGRTPADVLARTHALLERFRLPTVIAPEFRTLLGPYLRSDKKRQGERLRLPVVPEIGKSHMGVFPLVKFQQAMSKHDSPRAH